MTGLGAALLASVIAAEGAAGPARVDPVDPAYGHAIETWRRERLQRLTADGGWLTVAGLHWLKPGANRFGCDPTNDIVLPARSAPGRAGTFVLASGRVQVEVRPGVALTLAGKLVTRAALGADAGGATPDVLSLGALTLQIVDRGGRLGVRVKDMNNPARRAFKGLQYFPIDARYRVVATFVPHPSPVQIDVPTVLGTVERMPSPGYASFTLPSRPGGPPLRLDAVREPGETQLFFIFRDATSGKSSYGGGRFLYADPPAGGKVVLDFNRAYSPPCAFTPHATCPLPPANNRLPVAVEAGEMFAGH